MPNRCIKWANITVLILVSIGWGCSSPKPVLYPNDHLNQVGEAQAERDIAECEKLADEHVASSGKGKRIAKSAGYGALLGAVAGAIWGAFTGDPGFGAAIGAASGAAAGTVGGAVRESGPNQTYTNFVDQCLTDRGYKPKGWE